jgi:SAM-dependent methyltransferase
MPSAGVPSLAALIDELSRAHRASSPAPRGLPYLGLEHASGTGLHLLDALAARGIFRKYELVLDLGAGLGATSRWLATRLGCNVVGTAADLSETVAGRELTGRAGLAGQVSLIPADPGVLPFRSGSFTHVWIVETLARVADPHAALAEARRVLRHGGTLAVQELVTAEPTRGVRIPGWRPTTAAARAAAVRDAGFVDLEIRDRTEESTERSAPVLAARARLHQRLAEEPALAAVAGERQSLASALGAGLLRVVQFLARRP